MALDFAAGCLGGCAGVFASYPLDTVKVHLQTQNAKCPLYRGTFDCLRSLVIQDGVRGLYRGMSSPILGIAGINAIVFGVYGNVQRQLPRQDSFCSHFIAGSTAGLAQSSICGPMELVKTRLQITKTANGLTECFRNILRDEGFRGVFRGFGITVVRDTPSIGIYFASYEYLTQNDNNEPVTTVRMLISGGLAGVASWAITYPIDVVKSRLQADGENGPYKYKNARDCLKQSLKSESYHFLFKGFTSTMIRAFVSNAACFTVVHWIFRLLETKLETFPNDNEKAAVGFSSDVTLWEKWIQNWKSFGANDTFTHFGDNNIFAATAW